jgi:hypothetical protein
MTKRDGRTKAGVQKLKYWERLDSNCGRPSVCDAWLSHSTRHDALILKETEQPLISIQWREELGYQQFVSRKRVEVSADGTGVSGEKLTSIALANCFLTDEALVSIETGAGHLNISIILNEWTRYLGNLIRRTGLETKFEMEEIMILAGERLKACASDGLLTIECWDINDRQAIPVTGTTEIWSKVLGTLREFLIREATERLPGGHSLVVDAEYFA